MPEKTIHGPNRARSAMAPEISATVMIAKTAWKATKAIDGMVKTRLVAAKPLSMPSVPIRPLRPRNSNGFPHRPLRAGELERLAQQAAADVVAEGHRVAVEHPQHADERQRAEAHHHHVQADLRADHPAVEGGHARCLNARHV